MEPGDECHDLAVGEPRPIRGSALPLFDRLEQEGPESEGERRVEDSDAVRESVRQELARLLNTRAARRGPLEPLVEGTVLDYGLPDFSALTPASEADRNRLARMVAARIAAHEPRLRDIRVEIGPDPASPRSVIGAIAAVLVIGTVFEPVTFQVGMDLGARERAVSLT